MKIIKYILALAFLIGWSLFAVPYLSSQSPLLIGLTSLILILAITNFTLRKNLGAKPYFTSKWNIFTSLHKQEFTFPISAELLLQKFEEELKHSKFKVVASNPNTLQLLATTSMTWKSWGENIYITFKKEETGACVIIESVTVFQIIDYEKNAANISKLVYKIENSFTV